MNTQTSALVALLPERIQNHPEAVRYCGEVAQYSTAENMARFAVWMRQQWQSDMRQMLSEYHQQSQITQSVDPSDLVKLLPVKHRSNPQLVAGCYELARTGDRREINRLIAWASEQRDIELAQMQQQIYATNQRLDQVAYQRSLPAQPVVVNTYVKNQSETRPIWITSGSFTDVCSGLLILVMVCLFMTAIAHSVAPRRVVPVYVQPPSNSVFQ